MISNLKERDCKERLDILLTLGSDHNRIILSSAKQCFGDLWDCNALRFETLQRCSYIKTAVEQLYSHHTNCVCIG